MRRSQLLLLNMVPFLIFMVCRSPQGDELPYYGRPTIKALQKDANRYDTVPYQIPDFQFLNQNNEHVTNQTFNGKVYVTDFFFSRCPTICPIMKSQLHRVYLTFESDSNVLFLSHTVDPKHDSVEVLKNIADQLGVNAQKWHFVTGDKQKIYEMAQKGYYVSALEDDEAPGGFSHSGTFILIDQNRHIRGLYDGTNPERVDQLIQDIPKLLP